MNSLLLTGKIALRFLLMMPVVIVDDSSEDAAFGSRAFAQCKILNPIRMMKSGDECIEFFEQAKEDTLPCLLLIDLIMAPTSGLDVLRYLHTHENAKGSILVMLSGISDYNIVREGYQLGAATFLVKPLLAEDVLQMVQGLRDLTVSSVPEGYILSPKPQSLRVWRDADQLPDFSQTRTC